MLFHDTSQKSLAALLLAHATETPHAPALWQADQHITYQDLLGRVRHVVATLTQLGIQPGTAVALLFQNTIDCVVTCLALAWLQACLVPVEPEISSEHLTSMQNELGFTWIAGHAITLQQLAASLTHVRQFIVDAEPTQVVAASNELLPSIYKPREVFVYHYTSGSAGLPKAAMHSQENLINGGIIYQHTFHIGSTDRILSAVPLLHSFGMVAGMVTALVTGAALILSERFVPRRLAQTIADTGATILLAVPLMYELMAIGHLATSSLDFSALRLCLSTGAAIPDKVADRFQRGFGKAIYHVYGCSEAGIIAAQTPVDDPDTRLSVGRPVVGVEVRVVDEFRQVLSTGAVGLLEVRTPAMFYGYFDNPAATSTVLHEGWYQTCDLARQREDGYLYLCGRKETFINVGGKKVNPLQIEQVLCTHPSVSEAVVWGEVTDRATESVHAMVVLLSPVAVAELIAFCRARLQPYQVPVTVEVVTSLPRTAMGKVQRYGRGSAASIAFKSFETL